jgi:hypothetical protein
LRPLLNSSNDVLTDCSEIVSAPVYLLQKEALRPCVVVPALPAWTFEHVCLDPVDKRGYRVAFLQQRVFVVLQLVYRASLRFRV